MSTPQEQFQAFLEQQRVDYRRTLPDKVAQMQALWAAADANTAPPALTELERLAHTLAGTAGTLGFRELGLAARSVEVLLADAAGRGTPLSAGQSSDIALALSALQASLPRA